MLGKKTSPDVSQVRPWLIAVTDFTLSPFGLGTPKVRGGGVSGLDAVSRSAGSVLLGVISHDANYIYCAGCNKIL